MYVCMCVCVCVCVCVYNNFTADRRRLLRKQYIYHIYIMQRLADCLNDVYPQGRTSTHPRCTPASTPTSAVEPAGLTPPLPSGPLRRLRPSTRVPLGVPGWVADTRSSPRVSECTRAAGDVLEQPPPRQVGAVHHPLGDARARAQEVSEASLGESPPRPAGRSRERARMMTVTTGMARGVRHVFVCVAVHLYVYVYMYMHINMDERVSAAALRCGALAGGTKGRSW